MWSEEGAVQPPCMGGTHVSVLFWTWPLSAFAWTLLFVLFVRTQWPIKYMDFEYL